MKSTETVYSLSSLSQDIKSEATPGGIAKISSTFKDLKDARVMAPTISLSTSPYGSSKNQMDCGKTVATASCKLHQVVSALLVLPLRKQTRASHGIRHVALGLENALS